MPAPAAVHFAPAADHQLPLLQTWLPQAFLGRPRPLFLAGTHDSGATVAAASLRRTEEGGQILGRFLLHVQPDLRRRGLGTAMLRLLETRARADGYDALLAGSAIDDSDLATSRFFQQAGFAPLRTIRQLRVAIASARTVTGSVCDRLARRGRIPDGQFAIVPLRQIHPDTAARFVLDHLGGIPESVRRPFTTPGTGYHPDLSLVLTIGDTLKAVLLATATSRDHLSVSSRVVSPDCRRGWVNAVLLDTFLDRAAAAGHTTVDYEADTGLHAETVRMTAHGDGHCLGSRHLFGRLLRE